MSRSERDKMLRSRAWFDDPADPGMTALHVERYLNYGLTLEELQSGKPIIGIAQTGSDLSPCNRHHLQLAARVAAGVRDAGGLPLEFPVHPIQETTRRPTAALDRNLAYLGLVEVLHGYPLDGVVLTIGCDKTTPACLMAAATVDLPAIALSVGPMLNGWFEGKRVGSGTIVWESRRLLAAGQIDFAGFMQRVTASTTSAGYCNVMGTASTMNAIAEALGMQLPGSAAIPAPHRERAQVSYETGRRIVQMVREDLRPSAIMTREAFLNAIVLSSAIGGSTNAIIHLQALAGRLELPLELDDFDKLTERAKSLGWTASVVLDGGTHAWAAAGLELYSGVNVPSKLFGELVEQRYGTPHITAHELARRPGVTASALAASSHRYWTSTISVISGPSVLRTAATTSVWRS